MIYMTHLRVRVLWYYILLMSWAKEVLEKRRRYIINLLLGTGARANTIINIKIGDVDLEDDSPMEFPEGKLSIKSTIGQIYTDTTSTSLLAKGIHTLTKIGFSFSLHFYFRVLCNPLPFLDILDISIKKVQKLVGFLSRHDYR